MFNESGQFFLFWWAIFRRCVKLAAEVWKVFIIPALNDAFRYENLIPIAKQYYSSPFRMSLVNFYLINLCGC